MSTAIGLVSAEVFTGLLNAPALLVSAAGMIRATGLEQEAAQANERAAECAGILLIPWPFIYIGSSAWIAAVVRLRDGLPTFVDLEPVASRTQAASPAHDERAAAARAEWEKLSEPQRKVLTDAGITAEQLRVIGPKRPDAPRR